MVPELHPDVWGVRKKIQMTNFTMPNNISSMKYALKSVPGLHPDVCIKDQKLWPESHLPCTDRQIRNGQESLLILSSFLLFLDDSSQCTAKASLEKGSSWPPEAIPYGVSHTRPLLATPWTRPTPWTQPQVPLGGQPPLTIRLLKKDALLLSR